MVENTTNPLENLYRCRDIVPSVRVVSFDTFYYLVLSEEVVAV